MVRLEECTNKTKICITDSRQLARSTNPKKIREWFYQHFGDHDCVQIHRWIEVLVRALTFDEIFGDPDWWKRTPTIREYRFISSSLVRVKPTVETYLWFIQNGFYGLSERVLKEMFKYVLRLSEKDKRRIVDLCLELDRNCFFGQSLDFKLKMGLPNDGHPQWNEFVAKMWPEQWREDVWMDWSRRHAIDQVEDVYEYIDYPKVRVLYSTKRPHGAVELIKS